MEHLTKQQIILLAIFVSLFSSAVTAIIAVSLSSQANPPVAQTVNHFIERTVQSGATANGSTQIVVERSDQATTNAIATVSKSIARIAGGINQFLGIGIVVSTTGRIVARIPPTGSQKLSAHMPDGAILPLMYLSTDSATGLSLFMVGKSASTSAEAFVPATLADSGAVKLGQSAAIIAGTYAPMVSTAFIAGIDASRIIAGATVPVTGFDSQAILANLIGEVVGIADPVGNSNSNTKLPANAASFIPSNLITSLITQ